MKKFLLMAVSCLLLAAMTTSALANEWGLRGGVYDIVSDTDRYDGYSAMADDGSKQTEGRHVNHAILQNRYHAVLLAAARGKTGWQAENISTTAVYQPGQNELRPRLKHDGSGFVLTYEGDKCTERYTFFYSEEQGEYLLGDVRYIPAEERYANSLTRYQDGMLFWQSGPEDTFLPIGDAQWETDGITLSEFNIAQMPRSLAQMRSLNCTAQALRGRAETLQIRQMHEAENKKRTLPVYSAPDADSYRSGSGKASVSTGGEMAVYGTAEGWTLIQYEVSPRTSRIGYVQAELTDTPLAFADLPLVTQAETILTDDPFVSQYAQAILPKGTEITGLAVCGEYYAYAEATLAGKLYRGFVPMKDLLPKYDLAMTACEDLLMADVRWDVMDALVGKWYQQGGRYKDKLVLYADGTYRNHMPGDGTADKAEGNYRVYDAAHSDGSTYELYFRTEDNQETSITLRLNEDGTITLSTDKMETVYVRNEYSTFGNG